MQSFIPALVFSFLFGVAHASDAKQAWQFIGQVVDEHGNPVDDFEAATFWLSNGNWWDETGELLEEAAAGKMWDNEGVLAASPKHTVTRLPEGRFSLTVDGWPRKSVYVVDKSHQYGGIALVEQNNSNTPVKVTLTPLVRVTAEVYCSEAGRTPDFSVVEVLPVKGEANFGNFIKCGSFRGEISLLLPPGIYDLRVRGRSPNASIPVPKGQNGIRIEIPRSQASLDLGVLNVALPKDKDGNPSDISKFYGKKPPELSITDARGLPKDVKLADFRGKWVLLEFWAMWCGPCVKRELPKLAAFYKEHAADLERFEIISICNTEKEQIQTIEAFDKLSASVVNEVWGGKQLPFPILLDGQGRTSGLYSVVSWPTTLLIDPEGNLIKNGGFATLAEKLKGNKQISPE